MKLETAFVRDVYRDDASSMLSQVLPDRFDFKISELIGERPLDKYGPLLTIPLETFSDVPG